jgi:hypothetical protein
MMRQLLVIVLLVSVATADGFHVHAASASDAVSIAEPRLAHISMDIASRSPRTSLIGFLHGFVGVTEGQIAALKPVYWRSFGHRDYEFLQRLGIETSVEFGYSENGKSVPVDSGNKDRYVAMIKQRFATVMAAADACHLKLEYFEFWNEGEGDYVWNPMVRGARVDKFEREYYAFKIFHDTIRSLKPDAKLVAPSSAHFWPELMEDFMRRCSRDNLRLDAISWHVPDFQAHQLPGQIELVRGLMRKYGNLRAREIHLNEWGWPNIGTGSQISFFYYMEQGGVDRAAKSIWGVEPLDNLLVQTSAGWQPRVSYWAWKFYAQMGVTRCRAETDDPFVVGLAAPDQAEPSLLRLIVARATAARQYSSDPTPLPKPTPVGRPRDIALTLRAWPFDRAEVRITRLPPGDAAMPTDPTENDKLTTASTKCPTAGRLELGFSNVCDEETFLVTIRPAAR